MLHYLHSLVLTSLIVTNVLTLVSLLNITHSGEQSYGNTDSFFILKMQNYYFAIQYNM